MTVWLTNALSLSMLPPAPAYTLRVRRVTMEEARPLAIAAVSRVGHADTAALLSGLLGTPVSVHRASLQLEPQDVLLVAQYAGPRLPEGTVTLPDGAHIDWYVVECHVV